MTISLVWWALQLSLWLFMVLIYLIVKVSDKIDKYSSDGMACALVKYFDAIAVRGTGINLHEIKAME